MIETITPAVCGSRRRRRIAVALFGLAAILAAALVGAALGALGAALGARQAVIAVAVLAGLAAASELGFLRLPLPQLRLQVPDWWRFQLPLPVWAAGYGAGLGVGVLTYQPFATFWIACVAAVTVASPGAAAACFALYGAGRTLMVAWPARGGRDAPLAVEGLVSRRPALARANGLVLAATALALGLAAVPAAAAQPIYLGGGNQLDPSVSSGTLAYTQRDGTVAGVVLRPSGSHDVTYTGRTPSLDGNVLAYAAADGIHVVRWRSREELQRAPNASMPALDWPWLAYRIDTWDGARELWLTNLASGDLRLLTRVGAGLDLGRASVAAGRVAWTVSGVQGSRIGLYTIETEERRIFVRSKISVLANPALSDSRILWVEQKRGFSYLRLRPLESSRTTTLASSGDRDLVFWTTALSGRDAYVTVWLVSSGVAQLERYRF